MNFSFNVVILKIFLPVLQGSYRIRLQFLGEEGDLLACANINFSIVWKRGVVETLESFNPIELHKNAAERAAPVAHT